MEHPRATDQRGRLRIKGHRAAIKGHHLQEVRVDIRDPLQGVQAVIKEPLEEGQGVIKQPHLGDLDSIRGHLQEDILVVKWTPK